MHQNVSNSAQASEQLFRSIFENAQLGISVFNVDGRAVFSNRALHQMLGYTAEELNAIEKWDEIIHPEERAYGAERYAALVEGKRDTDEFERCFIHRNGHLVISNGRFQLLRDATGKPQYVVALIEDITERKRAQEGMKANEQLFRSIFENAQIGIAYFKIDTQEHISNRALHEMLGYSGEELSRLGQWDEIVAPEERASGAERYAALIEGKRDTDEYEQQFIRRDGRIVVANDKFQLLRDAAGKPQYIVGLTEDITERKRAQEERSRLAKQMEMLLESTGQGIYGIDLQGNCTFINRATCELIDYRPEEVLGRKMHDLIHHHKPDGSVYPLDECPIYRAFKKGEGCCVDAEVIWRRDGSPLPVEYSSFPILEDGAITGAVVTVVDITERKRVQGSLQESEQLFRSIFENAPVGISLYNIAKSQYFTNRALHEMLDCTHEDLSSVEKWDQIVHPNERAACAKRYAELLEGERDNDAWEQRFIRRDGRTVVADGSFSVIRDTAGNPQYLLNMTKDITDRRQAEADLLAAKEEAVAATRAKSDFLANMSHEIRTPMNAILGMTHLALKTELTAKQRDYLTKTKVAAQALLGIINDILDFSKIEAGKLEIENTEFRLDKVVEDLSSVVSQKAHDKNLEFLIVSPNNLPPNLVGDPLRLGQILINLVNNAVKFTERGEVAVTVALEEQISERVKLKISVRDSGIGMTPEQTARLFQAFSQADTSTTRKYGGTGLGLSISKRLVEIMGGEIWVESTYGVGSAFIFTVWFGIGSTEAERKRFIPDLAGVRTLVVDDNALACEILIEELKVFSLRVDSVSSGEDAIRKLTAADSHDPYQLALIDWQMPGMDGLETSRIIKHSDRLKHIPMIVMVTGFGREDIRTRAEQMGIEGYLLKPVSTSTLYDTLLDLFGVTEKKEGPARLIGDAASHIATGIRILLVEDNEVNQQVATELLESAGAAVTIANHGGEALRILTKDDQPPPFDVVFMDLQMPEMDGYTATKLIRAQPHLQGLPIIAMTAHALVEERQKCLDAGMNDHVSKPIDPDALFATLLRWAKPRPAGAPGTGARPARTADDVILPEIEGVDVAGSLKRIGGNKRLYRDLLGQFVDGQGDAHVQISAAIKSGDRTLAERIAHTVKGVAGNIGLDQVFAAAKKLEKAIRDVDAAEPALLEEFTLVLNRQVEAIRHAFSEVISDQPTREGYPDFDPQAASAAITSLRTLLEACDADAAEAFLAVESTLAGTLERPLLDALGRAISEFDFDAALCELDKISERHGRGLPNETLA